MNTYNTAPYFDDFDENKGFHQILFKPGFAVQARELTQLQTILRDQIRKFGDHIFKHGSVVIPGNVFANLNTPYVKIASYAPFTSNAQTFNGKTIVGLTSGVKGIVKTVDSYEGSDLFYIAYTSGGGSSGTVSFNAGETVYIEDSPGLTAIIASTDHVGFGTTASINSGVYYINGNFVYVENQIVVVDKISSTPSASIRLKITESIVSSNEDETLLDPAQGSYNYTAPGADRLSIALDLVVMPLTSSIDDNYIELMRYDNGELLEHSRYPKYSELEKNLARRTFDESGNYVVQGYYPSFREHLKVDRNNGVFENGDSSKLVYEISPGKAYIEGFEVEKIARTRLVVDKARTEEHKQSREEIFRPKFGQYIYVCDITGAFSIQNRDIITFYNDNDSTNASASVVGTARVFGIDYVSQLSVISGIYKLYISDVSIVNNFTLEDVGGIRYGVDESATVLTKYKAQISAGGFTVDEIVKNGADVRVATVKYYDINNGDLYVYKHDHTKATPRLGDEMVGETSSTTSVPTTKEVVISEGIRAPIFRLPVNVASSLLNENFQYDLEYVTQKELIIAVDSLGQGSTTISSGVIDPIEDGTFVAISDSGIVPISSFSLNENGNTLSFDNITYANSTIYVYAHVTKTNISPKTKTITTVTETFSDGIGKKVLGNTDIIELVSVIDTQGDITVNYSLDNGQTEYGYNKGSITLKSGTAVGSISVTYRYYEHSTSGDFFCIDSYAQNVGYRDRQAYFVSKTTGETYNLYNCIDFRPSIGASGYSGAGAKSIDMVVNDTIFRTNLEFYLGRVDSIVLQKDNQPRVISGKPDESPTSPIIPNGAFEISRVYVPPYTFFAESVSHTRLDVSRYTMKDISNIVKRVERVEEYATLTQNEQSLTSFEVIDPATGLSRFKTGYLVEDFNEPLVLGRKTGPGYSASFLNTFLTAFRNETVVDFRMTTNSEHYQQSGEFVSLPYTEEIIFEQNQSSRITNINPFLVIRWDGTLEVIPPRDDYVEIRELPTIYETIENITRETIYETIYVQPPSPPPAPPRATPDAGRSAPIENMYQVATYGNIARSDADQDLYEYTGFESPSFAKVDIDTNNLSGTIVIKDARSGEEKTVSVTGTAVPGSKPELGESYEFKDEGGRVFAVLQPADFARAERIGYAVRDADDISDGSYQLNKLDQWKK